MHPTHKTHELHCYEYVNQPYTTVRNALRADPAGLFNRATTNAAHRAQSVVASLHVELGSLDLAADVEIRFGTVTEEEHPVFRRMTTIPLTWAGARSPALFPAMNAVLRVFPLSPTETQLELKGTYDPPLGVLGAAIDALVMHRVADASVHRFLAEVAQQLRVELQPD